MNSMTNIKIDGDLHEYEALSDEAKKIAARLQAVDHKIKEKVMLASALQKAKASYISELKLEVLGAKAGFDFEI